MRIAYTASTVNNQQASSVGETREEEHGGRAGGVSMLADTRWRIVQESKPTHGTDLDYPIRVSVGQGVLPSTRRRSRGLNDLIPRALSFAVSR